MLRALTCLAMACAAGAVLAADADQDGIADHVERRLGMHSDRPDQLQLVYDDKVKGEGDTSCGRDLRDAYDFTRV